MTQIMLRLDFFFYILILLGFPAAEMHSGHTVGSARSVFIVRRGKGSGSAAKSPFVSLTLPSVMVAPQFVSLMSTGRVFLEAFYQVKIRVWGG